MSVVVRKLGCVVAFVVLALMTTTATAQNLRDVDLALDAWAVDEAHSVLDAVEASQGQTTDTEIRRAHAEFLDGKYEAAVQRMDQLLTQEPRDDFQELRDLVAQTRDVVSKLEPHKSPKGYFEVWVEPGKDKVLLPWAFEALDAAYEAFADELGYKPPTPVRVEVYPQTKVLAKVSILTEEEIRTSGTIALCKYNRLMLTSPKALVRGYGWADTLVHEYVHYVINKRTRNGVPIWMHEGLAKFLERRWRGRNQHRLPPHSEQLLHERVADNDLITFAQMHPSMAKLPSQEDAAVAFAEVYTAMEYLQKNAGDDAFKRLLDEIATGVEATDAFANVLGTTFPQFERDWRASLEDRPKPPDVSDLMDQTLVFKDQSGGKTKDDFGEIEQPQARDHLNLGQMFQARGRPKAAIVQYRKAGHIMGSDHPRLQTRLAQCLLETNQAQQAYDALKPLVDRDPGYVATWIGLGRAALGLGRFDEAKEHLYEAARINPFDPEVHRQLALVYEKLGDAEKSRRAREFVTLVQ